MIKTSAILLVILLAVQVQAVHLQGQHYKKVVNHRDPEAKCLDGSTPIYYIHQGTETANFMIFFSGGWVFGTDDHSSTLEAVYNRSKTLFGSSLNQPETFNGVGYLSQDPLQNRFAEWTKIIVPYCDGALFQGYAKQPIFYQNTTLYFRGARITRSLFEELNSLYGLFNSEKVVLTGVSSGGVGAYLWSNYLRSKLRSPAFLFTIPDTSIFLNETNTDGKYLLSNCFINTYRFANIDEATPIDACNARFPGEEYKCLFFEHAYPSILGPTLILQSQYDSDFIKNIQNISCPQPGIVKVTFLKCSSDELAQIEACRLKLVGVLTIYLGASKENSLWAIACAGHGYGIAEKHYNNDKERVPQENGLTVREAVERFVFDGERVKFMDSQPWPLNKPCAY